MKQITEFLISSWSTNADDTIGIGVSFPIVEMSVFFRRMRSGYPRRAVFGDVLASATNLLPPSTLMAFVLGQRGKAKHET